MTNPNIIRTPEGWHVLKHDSHLSRWIEEHRTLGVAEGEMPNIEKYIPLGGVIVDAGANLGDHTFSYAKRVGPSGLVMSFEPLPDVFEALSLNFQNSPNVKVHNVGLSDKETEAFINTGTSNIGASFISEQRVPSDVFSRVRCVPLDSLTPPLPRLDFVHLDVEGYELNALRGAAETLRRFKPVLLVEINHGHLSRNGVTESGIEAFMGGLGYFKRDFDGNGPHQDQRDVLFLPR